MKNMLHIYWMVHTSHATINGAADFAVADGDGGDGDDYCSVLSLYDVSLVVCQPYYYYRYDLLIMVADYSTVSVWVLSGGQVFVNEMMLIF